MSEDYPMGIGDITHAISLVDPDPHVGRLPNGDWRLIISQPEYGEQALESEDYPMGIGDF